MPLQGYSTGHFDSNDHQKTKGKEQRKITAFFFTVHHIHELPCCCCENSKQLSHSSERREGDTENKS